MGYFYVNPPTVVMVGVCFRWPVLTWCATAAAEAAGAAEQVVCPRSRVADGRDFFARISTAVPT
jgi:hypothetical protein